MWEWIKKSIALHIVLVAFTAAVGYGAYRMVAGAALLSKQAGATEKRLADLKKKNDALRAEISEFDTQTVIEREAKARLNVKVPGEHVVILPPEEATTSSAVSSRETPIPPAKPWWRRALDFLSGNAL